jgi:hypothetical protein
MAAFPPVPCFWRHFSLFQPLFYADPLKSGREKPDSYLLACLNDGLTENEKYNYSGKSPFSSF